MEFKDFKRKYPHLFEDGVKVTAVERKRNRAIALELQAKWEASAREGGGILAGGPGPEDEGFHACGGCGVRSIPVRMARCAKCQGVEGLLAGTADPHEAVVSEEGLI